MQSNTRRSIIHKVQRTNTELFIYWNGTNEHLKLTFN